jgi:hypothetical protein
VGEGTDGIGKHLDEVTRFNGSIDQMLAELIAKHTILSCRAPVPRSASDETGRAGDASADAQRAGLDTLSACPHERWLGRYVSSSTQP